MECLSLLDFKNIAHAESFSECVGVFVFVIVFVFVYGHQIQGTEEEVFDAVITSRLLIIGSPR